jgi:hypothetical protein
LISVNRRAVRTERAIAKRVAAFVRRDRARPAQNVTPLNSGFFQLERLRKRTRKVATKVKEK